LVLAGTPIGDSRQAAPALLEALASADLIAAEDTRRLRQLARRLDLELTAPLLSYFEGNETERTPELVQALEAGSTVALVTDAGMPSVSDPGYRLVRAAVEAGVRVTAVPGPSAALTALAVSGLPVDRFCFEGFLPRRPGPRRARLAELADERRTMVFFEAPHRLDDFLASARDCFGPDRPGAICRELTKTYEEVVRGSLAELADWATGQVRGEITVVIAGLDPALGGPGATDPTAALALVQRRLDDGAKPTAAVAEAARRHGLDRHQLYQAFLAQRASELPDWSGEPARSDPARPVGPADESGRGHPVAGSSPGE
jgi:16S rRNA (cytidine1402-2'-O)-methyltransferase